MRFTKTGYAIKFLTKKYSASEELVSPFELYPWPLPIQIGPNEWVPGEWVQAKGRIKMCENGIHAARFHALRRWSYDHAFLIELKGVKRLDDSSKVVARKGRLLRPLAKRGVYETERNYEISIHYSLTDEEIAMMF